MKQNLKINLALWAGLGLAPLLAAGAVQTTYQINMGVQAGLGNFNPGNGDTVLVAGNFTSPNWTTTNTLAVSADPNIYVGTFDDAVAPGGFENHLFIINPGGNSTGGALHWESRSGGNRFFQVPATATNLPVVYFNDVTNANTIQTNPVTFQLDLSAQIALTNFDPTTDFAYVAGDAVNNWSATANPLTQSQTDTNLWTTTVSISSTVGNTVNYKFIINTFAHGQTWESDGVGPGGAQNRQFAFPNGATNLPAVYFNNITNVNSLVVTPITFQVDLAVQIAQGNFDPSSGTVTVAGDAINSWSATASPLTQSLTDTNTWSGTISVTNTVGSLVNYKFVLNNGVTWENNGVGATGTQNRQLAFPGTATNVPDVFFNNIGNLGALTLGPAANGQATASWTAGPNIRLQISTNAGGGSWQDVPNTQGQGSATVTVGPAPSYFRLTGP